MKFSENLKKLRKDNKLTQKELAEKLFMEQTTISGYENEKIQPTAKAINQMADFFNVSSDFLLGRTDRIAQINDLYNLSTDHVITGKEKKENYETKNNLEQTFEETIEELKQEETLMFMKDGDIDEESARLVKLAMKNAIRMVDEMNKNKNKE